MLIPFSDLGLGAAVVNSVSRRAEDAEREEIALDVTRRALRALIVVGIVVVVVAGILSAFSLWPSLLGIPQEFAGDANLAAFGVFCCVGAGIPFGLGQRLLVADNRTHLSTLISAITSIVSVGFTSAIALVAGPALLMAIATPAGILVAGIIATFVARKRLGWTWRQLFAGPPTRQTLTESLWKPAVPMLIVMIGAPLALQSHRLILAHVGSSAELSEYAVAAQFYVPALSIVTTGALALWPQFARGRGQQGRNWGVSLLLMALFGILGGVALALLLAPVSLLVSGGRVIVGFPLAISFAILLLVMSLHQPSAMLLTSTRGLWFQAVCMVALAATSIPLGVLTTPLLGAVGPVASTAAAVAITTLIPCIMYARCVVLRG